MDKIFLHDLRVETRIGAFDWERRIRQTIVFELEMGVDIRKAAASDKLADTLNYKSVAKRIIQFVSEAEYELVETLAEQVARLILKEFGVPWLRLSLNKTGAVRGARDVGIVIERTTADLP